MMCFFQGPSLTIAEQTRVNLITSPISTHLNAAIIKCLLL